MIDLRREKVGGTWVRRFGAHEDCGVKISVSDKSAHVTFTALTALVFILEREDVPTAWDAPIDVVKLREEMIAAIVRRMSAELLEGLFGEFRSQLHLSFWKGECAARTKIREALDL